MNYTEVVDYFADADGRHGFVNMCRALEVSGGAAGKWKQRGIPRLWQLKIELVTDRVFEADIPHSTRAVVEGLSIAETNWLLGKSTSKCQ